MSLWLSPAKLNLFLHVIGRRADGYHLLQSVFQLIDFYDEMEFECRVDGRVHQSRRLKGISEDQNLAIIAARRLQNMTLCSRGINISIKKNIPVGAGLGGGSSNAATTLIALNQIWELNLTRDKLALIGLEIGADVPFFVYGQNAWAEGVGENLTPIKLENCWYVVVIPPVHVSTKEIFSNSKLTHNAGLIKIRDFRMGGCTNQLQEITCRLYPQVKQVIDWLSGYGNPQMTGSGSAVFIKADSQQQAQYVAGSCPSCWQAIYARGLTKHPHG